MQSEWIEWSEQRPMPDEVFVALYYNAPLMCRYILPLSGAKPEVHACDAPVGIGPMASYPQRWHRLPSY